MLPGLYCTIQVFFFWLAGVGREADWGGEPGAGFSMGSVPVSQVVFPPSPRALRGLFLFSPFFAQSPVSSLEVPINLGTLLSPVFCVKNGAGVWYLWEVTVACGFCHEGGLSDGRTGWGWVAMGEYIMLFHYRVCLAFTRDREGKGWRCL